ncbi:MAG: hypothetical protein ACJAXX_002138 [Roseivirga sp.]|jgi:hypothetical protein
MGETLVTIALIIAAVYLLAGLIFAIPFLRKGIHSVDDGVKDAPLFMMALICPGVVALWPLLLIKWEKAQNT